MDILALFGDAWIPINSSWIAAARWDAGKSVLQLRTDAGRVYDCPASPGQALAFFQADSKGRYFNQHFRLRR